ncbi:MAG: glycosyltransferase family 4 protein [Acidimicrobiia bacterium]
MDDRTRVLVLAPSRGRGGGIERYVAGVCDALSLLDIPTRRVALTTASSQTASRKAATCAEALALALTWRPTHVLVMHPNLFRFAKYVGRVANASVTGWVYGAEAFSPEKAAAVVGRAAGIRLVAISEWTKRCLVEAGANDDLAVVLPAMSDQWLALTAAVANGRRESPTPRIAAITRFDADVAFKGVDTLIDVVARFARRDIRVDLDLVGIGAELGAHRSLALDQGVADRVHFLGWLPDDAMANVLARAWMFSLPSRLDPNGSAGEGFGIVYVEAASAGVPVVGSTDGGAAEAIIDEVTGLTIDPSDVDALVAAVERLCGDEGLRTKLGEEGARWVREEFTIERLARDLTAMLVPA